jgi:RNA polymerase sigma factor (sigma-70 family)
MAIESLGGALRQIGHLFGGGTVTGLSDAQLLDRFLADRDGSAFESLVARHGPMVLSVCRGVLRDPADAEDAYQATFLILVKKARTIRGGQALGGWLYRVAHRVAIRANVVAARRCAHEREAGQMTAASATSDPGAPDGLLPALHEEIARLPEKYRLPVVLCDLEGLPQAEAAGQLHWSERTLRRRLAEARDRLRGRLARRGLAPDGATLSAVFWNEARAVVPPAWNATVVRAAIHTIDPIAATGTVSAAVQSLTHEVLKAMFLQKLTFASAALVCAGLLAWAASAALVPRGDEAGKETVEAAPATRQSAPAAGPGAAAESDPLDAIGTFPVRGRVLDPDGKPVAGAEILVRHFTEFGWTPDDPAPRGQKGRVAVSDADGRFRFDLDKASSDWPTDDEPAWYRAQIAAVAPGLALTWVEARSLLKGDEATLRLVRDDVPIRGRVVDPQGRPIAGVTVLLGQIGTIRDGADLDAMLASGAVDDGQTAWWYGTHGGAIVPGGRNSWTTDADGRFEVMGVGRDRVAALVFQGPMLANSGLRAMARPARTPQKPRPQPARRDRDMAFFGRPPSPMLVGATFEHVAGPTKPIAGVVRSKATGRPVEGVRVFGMEGATWTSVSARTDAQGRFRLVGLPKGEFYRITANEGHGGVAPYLRTQITVTDTEGLKPIEMTIELPRGVVITGRLIDPATGRPVRAGQISYCRLPTNLNPGDTTQAPTSPTDPTFRLTVPPGEGMLYVQARGRDLPYTYARLRKADKGKGVGGIGDGETVRVLLNAHHAYKIIDVPADTESFRVDLELTRGRSRTGRVVDPDGRPVAEAQCYGLSPTWGELRTLADETFEVRGLEPGVPRQVIFAHKDRRLVGSVIIKGEEAGGEAPMVVRLDRPGSIKGRLVDEDGLPVAGATLGTLTINIDGDNLPPDTMWPDSETVTTGADGRFQIDGLKPGVKTNSGVTFKDRPGYWGNTGKALRDIVIQKPGEVRDLGDIKVNAVRR